MQLESIRFDIRDNVAHITLNQPERGNPIDGRFCQEFDAISTECSANEAVRAVLIDSKGKYFSVGGDLNSLAKDREFLPRFVNAATADLHMAVSRFARMNAPVVVAVHALAAGGAVALTAAADFALAAPSASFYAAFLGIGLISDTGGTHFLPRRVGSRRAIEFLMLNQTWRSEEAAAAGLINRIVPPDKLNEEAWALASELARGPTRSFGELKNLMLSTWSEPIESQLEHEARAMLRLARTEDTWGALQAVASKRKATFDGR